MKSVIGILIAVMGTIVGIYVGGWLMFIHSIIEACKAFDAGTLTGVMVGVTVLKCIFASVVGTLIAGVGAGIGKAIAS